jgi:peptidoglycan/xylan/chitin deacetylase (PgdA/CDA1 family)
MLLAARIVHISMLADAWLGKVSRRIGGERTGLVVLLFHNIFQDRNSVTSGIKYPHEGVTQKQFKTFLDCWREAGYRFVSTQDILAGLDKNGKYVILTFDDGYRSILDVVPILEEYNAPVILFVTSYNIENEHAYWPDIVYREELVRGKSPKEASTLIESLKKKHISNIQQFILKRYGTVALVPVDNSARPLTKKELFRLSNHPLIEIGNHTENHVDLTICKIEEIRREIAECQKAIKQITGKSPVAISYPFGRYNDEVLSVVQSEGLFLGFTCSEGKNQLPLIHNTLKIHRFDFLGDSSPDTQCDRFRSDVHICWPVIKKSLEFWSRLHKQPYNHI